MIRTMVQLTEEQMKALKELAKARKTSVSKLVRESVSNYIVTIPTESSIQEKRRRALEALEIIEREGYHDIEGKTDLSINHDKYFSESIQ